MKRTTIFAAATLIAMLLSSNAMAGATGKLLADLESHIKWSAVDGAWRSLRPDWVRTTTACEETACVAAQLLKLEENVKWSAVDKEWKIRRDGWIRDCRGAERDHDIAKLLLEFEENVRGRVLDDAWKTRHESWVAEVKSQ